MKCKGGGRGFLSSLPPLLFRITLRASSLLASLLLELGQTRLSNLPEPSVMYARAHDMVVWGGDRTCSRSASDIAL
jgi:hypothetical protein